MAILVYHGSRSLFEQFVIDPNLAITREDYLVEGFGIYLTENQQLAKDIGQYTYEVSIDESDLTDMTDRHVVETLIRNTLNTVNRLLVQYVNLDTLVNGIVTGDLSVTKLQEELISQLDSNEKFYIKFGDQVTYEDDCFMEKIRSSFLQHAGNVFKYYDVSYGHNNLICFRNPECLSIVHVTKKDE